MGTRPADCRKFTPNIFNKSKCSHCFRQREEHSAAALECNRACRKVSKCGYLFVAPDWDFSNPLYRTKRWQRRWFVLYDDGELTYSVDEHPETIPQACIDMTKVLEVSTAEDVTGHVNSLAVTAPDRVTFVKGTCPDEAKWWLNILSAFPKTKGRHKRNATFPGGQTTTILQSQSATTPSGRNRHNSYHTDSIPSPMASLEALPAAWSVPALPESAGDSLSRVYTDQPVSSKSPPTRDKLHPEGKAQARIRSRNRVAQDSASDSATECLIIEDARRDEKLKNIANTITNLSHHSITTSVGSPVINNRWSTVDDKPTRDETDYIMEFTPATANTTSNNTPVRPKSLAIISPTAPAIVSAIVKKLPPTMSKTDLDTARLISSLKQQAHERGDPDGGCNLDDISSNYLAKNSELRVNLPSEEILNSKKGWLMKQELRSGEWTKHWFTLRGAALFYYRDPVAEDRGVLDGVLDVNGLTNVSEIPVARNYGFQLTMWDNKRIVLSTVNSNTRGNWINVLNNAAGLNQKPQQPPPQCQNEMVGPIVEMKDEKIIKDNTSDDLKSEIEKDFMKAQRNQDIIINTISAHETTNGEVTPVGSKTLTPVTPITPKSILFSSDEEYRTASEGGRRDSVDWGSPMSPSPPVPLSLSRTKDRVRSRSNSGSRLHKRSRSSPPSSRRSTVDSVGSEDMIMIRPVLEEMSGDIELQSRFNAAEKELRVLRDEGHEREARMTDLLSTLERTELELSHRIQETEEARTVLELQLAENRLKADELAARLTIDVEESQKRCKELEDRLTRGIEENEVLYKKIREIENSSGHATSLSNLNRTKMKRMDSLSDLTCLNDIDPYCLDRDMLADEYNDLKSRFEKAINEIRAMKKELRESQNEFDQLEISHAALKQDLERQEREDRCQIKMMAQRIQDLTVKYSNSERQVRALKQKLAKSEKRRSLSLKGRESLTVQKELEEKVVELENKIDHLEAGQVNGASDGTRADATQQDERSLRRAAARLRRKSLDSPSDAMQMMLRIGTLEKRVERATISPTKKEQITASPNNSSSKISEHLLERLRTLEGVVISSKDRIEQGLQQLQSLKSSRTRRSVSPIAERKDSFRFIERCLTETVKVLRDSCDTCIVHDSLPTGNLILLPETSPIKLALTQLEAQLRGKLGDLLKQRRFLREHNELTPRKDIELLAERIAYESVCFGRLRDAISRAENPALFGEQQTQTEVAETAQLMSYLKMKLSGKTTIKPSGSADILASVLARRLVLSTGRSGQLKLPEMAPINQNIMEDLLRQQNELNLIAKRYKNNAMENLASGLAAETLSYISTNDAVQGAVQEAWRQAQEVVNAELVQSEIGNIMMRNAKRFENSLTPAFGYTLTSEERVSFENFSDAVQDALRKEMELAINALNQCYAECMTKMKRGQWRMHLEHEHNASTGRQLLAEFADIVAHKALVDARISVLKGEYTTKDLSTTKGNQFNVAALQKYENLFTELATDLQVSNADDILAEADFNFLYKNFTTEYITNKEELREASSVLNKLEQAVVMLQSTLNPNTSVSMSIFEADNLQSLCQKCADLQSRVESLNPCAQRLQAACEDCDRMQEAIIHLSDHHQSEMESLSHQHELQCNTMQRNLDEQSAIVERLRREREETISVLDRERTSLAQREQEFKDVCKKFSTLESEYQTAEADKSEIVQCLDNTRVQAIMHADETKKAMEKCRAQADELNAVLEERDFIQEQLDRERERVRKLEMKLELLEQEHSQQMDNLHAAYKSHHDTNSSDNERERNEEECFRKRYQAEIEQLRTLCEKGLSAMESSHRRIINELEEKHRQETQHLLSDKEQALAEETQATLAALDAMRKAHQIEVQREVARFKAEFIKQFQKGNQPEVNHRGNEEELEEVRQEILSLSEKYSFKCVETAKLEEKLRMVTQQLKQFQMHIQQLEVRNKQLRAHLVADEPDLSFTQSLSRETSLSSTSEV